jgi:hypothetical protein
MLIRLLATQVGVNIVKFHEHFLYAGAMHGFPRGLQTAERRSVATAIR